MKKHVSTILLAVLILLPLLAVVSAATPSLQVTGYRFNAKGGVRGPPSDTPKPPNGEEPPAIEYDGDAADEFSYCNNGSE